ncbi:rhamnosyltransferase [Lachnospiraceae bacterium A10]|nr:rhamnosyltransferase [Lachnospiraceae bacterium A10]
MILEKGNNNRHVIYLFYDRDGIVDEYILYMLSELKKCVRGITVVCNGVIPEAEKQKLEKYVDEVYERENKGFDVWAYKSTLEHIGWEKLATYDEVILMNYTIMGPVYPLQEMFDEMDARDLDYWGPTISHKTDFDPFGKVPYGYLPDHIQTHFLAIRRSLLMSKEFMKYWKNMPMINNYTDSVGKHEAVFTKHFEDLGFKWDVYANSEEYRDYTYQPVLVTALEMIRDQRLPFFKRRSFMQNYEIVMDETVGQAAYQLMEYIDKHTNYDVNLIWDNLLRVENMADLKKNLQLNYVIPSDSYLNPENGKEHKNKKIALIMHMYFEDLISECLYYAKSMPEYADIYITTNTEQKKKKIEEAFSVLPNKVDVRLSPNRGRDVGPFLVESRDYIYDYDYICHTHDKKVGQLKPGSVGASFSHRCFENVLRSREMVENVIETFENNPRMGIIMPPPPNHSEYFFTLGLEWGMNFGVTKDLAEELGIHVNMDEKKEPIAPLGSVFWARTDALRKIFDRPWTYEDFPEEPVADDGTILHAVERMYNFSAQACGYYAGWLFSDYGAKLELTNLYYMLRTVNTKLMYDWGICGSLQKVALEMTRKGAIYNSMPDLFIKSAKVYYIEEGGIPTEDKTAVSYINLQDGVSRFTFTDIKSQGKIASLRFDPGESRVTWVRKFKMKVTDVDGTVHEYGLEKASTNGKKRLNEIFFLEDDPQITIDIKPCFVEKVEIEAVITKDIPNWERAKLKSNIFVRFARKVFRKIRQWI